MENGEMGNTVSPPLSISRFPLYHIWIHVTLCDGSMTLYADDIMLYRPIYTPADYSLAQQDIDDI